MRRRVASLLLLVAVADARADGFEVRPFLGGDEGRCVGICYGPHRDGQRPGGPTPSAAEIAQDLRLLAAHWTLMRVYGSSELAKTMLSTIRDEGLDMKVMLGAWIAPDDSAGNRREVDAAIELANTFGEIVAAVSVGNETQVSWSTHQVAPRVLIDAVERVRSAVAVPVTVVDDFNFWNKPQSRSIATHIDFVTMNAHPMWNGAQLEDAPRWLQEQFETVAAVHPDRPVVVGETGWATSVGPEGEQAALIRGRPGEIEQASFTDAVTSWSRGRHVRVFLFEAFDENWKGGANPADVEKHWGLFRADRTPKAAVAGP
jgi:exo-beta-1,3-glucanase (GH17 family)